MLCSGLNFMDLTGRVMNLNAFRVVDSFWTGGELGAVKETEVSVEKGEKEQHGQSHLSYLTCFVLLVKIVVPLLKDLNHCFVMN